MNLSSIKISEGLTEKRIESFRLQLHHPFGQGLSLNGLYVFFISQVGLLGDAIIHTKDVLEQGNIDISGT